MPQSPFDHESEELFKKRDFEIPKQKCEGGIEMEKL